MTEMYRVRTDKDHLLNISINMLSAMKKSILALTLCMGFVVSLASSAEDAGKAKRIVTFEESFNAGGLISLRGYPTRWNTDAQGHDVLAERGNRMAAPSATQSTDGPAYRLEFTNRQRVWRYATRGDYWLVETATGGRRQLGVGLPEASLMFAKLSPDGKRVAYVSAGNIYVEPCSMKAIADSDGSGVERVQLTSDGCETIVNGTFDWVYEEEFGCRDGFRWSSDSRSIAFWQCDTEGTGWFDIINNIDSIYPTVKHFPYPKAGTANSAVRIGVLDVQNPGSAPSWIDIPGDARGNYLPRMEFVPGTGTLMIQQMNRAQNTNTLWRVKVSEGRPSAPERLCVDVDEAWVETNDDIHWLQGGKYFTFTSERDGWRHLYRVSADGKHWTCLTDCPMDVINEVAYDERNGYIYFTATPDNATERYLFRTRVMGKGAVENVTAMCHPEGLRAGQYSYTFSPHYEQAVETWSDANHVPVYSLVGKDGRGRWSTLRVLEDNAAAQAELESLAIGHKEFVTCKSGDLTLDAWIIKPADFDPTKKYPVIDHVYGEPASATVQNRWDSNLFWHYLANQGYVVVSIENRGAAAPRGREWRKCIYGQVGVAASEDQARGVIDLCRQFEWMDSTRIGITGWSGGGSQTLNSMFRYPDVFKTGVAIAFVADQRLYDTIYQERYMNTPQANPEGYFRGSPINFAEGLRGNLLLIHGTGDDNVHYQNCEMLVDRLIALGKRFYQVSYPMRTHGISEGPGTYGHVWATVMDFFGRNL